MQYVNYNGKLLSTGEAIISASSRGLRYGDGLFETIRYSNGQLIMANEHFARLWKGMQVLSFKPSKHFTPEKLEEDILALIQKNGHHKGARVRLMICRGDGGLFDAVNHIPNYIIETAPLPEGNGQWNSNGLVLGIYPVVKKSCDILANLKHNNYLPYVMAAMHAKAEKWNDAILLNTSGSICDSCIANIFIIHNDIVLTPPLDDGCVAGVMREHVLQQLQKLGYVVTERSLTTADLFLADEVFLTNSVYNIRWVQQIGDKEYSNTLTQKIYNDLLPTIF